MTDETQAGRWSIRGKLLATAAVLAAGAAVAAAAAFYPPHLTQGVKGAGMAGGAVVMLIALYISSTRRRRPKEQAAIYGDARFATPADMEASGFLDQSEGVYIGGWTDPKGVLRYLRHNGREHVAAIAPTRSGKGVGLVVPTLLSWPHSAIVKDEKGELWELTSGWRAGEGGNTVFRWAPSSWDASCGFNFLDEIRLGTPYEVGDAQVVAMMLADPEGKGIIGNHWAETAFDLITAVILHVCYSFKALGKQAALPDVDRVMSDPNQTADELYEEMVANTHVEGQTHLTVAAGARKQLNRGERERASVHSSATTFLQIFGDPIISKNARHSDFRIADLMNADKPVTLYIVVPGNDKARLRPLIRLMWATIISGIVRKPITFKNGEPQMPHKHRLLMMMDEFPSDGRLSVIEESLAKIAGWGVLLYLIMQDEVQLRAAYGEHEAVLSNCHIHIAYAPNRIETAEWLSRVLGRMTVNIEDYSESGKREGSLNQVSHSVRQIGQDLMTPEQVLSLQGPVKNGEKIVKAGEMLIKTAGMKARVRGTQILYFRDPVFHARSLIPPAPANANLTRRAQAFRAA